MKVKLCLAFVKQFWNENTVIMVLVNSKKYCLCSLDAPQMLLSAHSAQDHITRAMARPPECEEAALPGHCKKGHTHRDTLIL